MKATEPVGVPLPEATVALNVTALFNAGEAEEACSVVVVTAGAAGVGAGEFPLPPHPASVKPEAASSMSTPRRPHRRRRLLTSRSMRMPDSPGIPYCTGRLGTLSELLLS